MSATFGSLMPVVNSRMAYWQSADPGAMYISVPTAALFSNQLLLSLAGALAPFAPSRCKSFLTRILSLGTLPLEVVVQLSTWHVVPGISDAASFYYNPCCELDPPAPFHPPARPFFNNSHITYAGHWLELNCREEYSSCCHRPSASRAVLLHICPLSQPPASFTV